MPDFDLNQLLAAQPAERTPMTCPISCLCRKLLLAALLIAGCGSQDPSANATDAGTSTSNEPLLPWKTGNTWTYQVTESTGDVGIKVNTIGAEEPIGGSGPFKDKLALKVVTTKRGGADETISWQQREGDRVLRYREQAFSATTGMLELEEHWDPYKLRVDSTAEHTVAGFTWLEEYKETKLPVGDTARTSTNYDRWVVRAVGESITVPAGTFTDTVVLEKIGGDVLKTYWFARGVGKVKETGGQTEELVEYEVSP
jgi:hypothetical protein